MVRSMGYATCTLEKHDDGPGGDGHRLQPGEQGLLYVANPGRGRRRRRGPGLPPAADHGRLPGDRFRPRRLQHLRMLTQTASHPARPRRAPRRARAGSHAL